MILTATRGGDLSGAQRFETTSTDFSIGRGVDCDWTLPDPDRLLSKLHCRITLVHGAWLVSDLSSNGMTLNGQALRQRIAHPVNSGDRLGLGAYELAVSLESAAAEPTLSGFPAMGEDDAPFGHDPQGGSRRIGDPFVSPGSQTITDPFDVGLPSGFGTAERNDNPFAREATARAGSAADSVSDLHAPFAPPRTSHSLLPEDWDAEIHEPVAPAPPAFAPPPEPQPAPQPERSPFEPMIEPAPPAFFEEPPPAPAEPTPAPMAEPQPARYVEQEPAPVSPPAAAASAATPSVPDDAALRAFAAFARGAGLEGTPREAPEQALEQLGRAFRAYVVGLRRLMIARATIKGEFRIDQTMIRPFGNNPLKFATDDDDAMAALLGIGRQVGMSAEQAVADSLRDVHAHELALTRAIQQGIRELVTELSPAEVKADLPGGPFDALPVVRNSRSWKAYARRHAKTEAALGDNLDGVFGQSFARAYGTALAEVQAAHEDESAKPGGRRS